MDEALEAMDEGINNLVSNIINVNNRTKQIMLRLKSLECFLEWFLAMNVLLVPVVISILICFSTRNTVDSSGLEAGYQLAVTFLMFISGTLGIPLYVYAVWESYRSVSKLKQVVEYARLKGNLDSPSLSDTRLLTSTANEVTEVRRSLLNLLQLLAIQQQEELKTRLDRRLDIPPFEKSSEERENIQEISRNLNSETELSDDTTGTNSQTELMNENNNKALVSESQDFMIAPGDNPDISDIETFMEPESEDLITNFQSGVNILNKNELKPKIQEFCLENVKSPENELVPIQSKE